MSLLSNKEIFDGLVKKGYKLIKLNSNRTPIDLGYTNPDFIYETNYIENQNYGIVGGSTHNTKDGKTGTLLIVDFDVKENYFIGNNKHSRPIPEAVDKLNEIKKDILDRNYYFATTKTHGLHIGVLSNEDVVQGVSLYTHQDCKLKIDTRTSKGYVVAIAPNYTITKIPETFDRIIPDFEQFMLGLGFVPTNKISKGEHSGSLSDEYKRKAREALDSQDAKRFPELGTDKVATHDVVTFWTMSCRARNISEDATVEKIMGVMSQIQTSKDNIKTEKDIRRFYNKDIDGFKEKIETKTEDEKTIQQLKKLSEIDNSEYANKTVKVNAVIASNSISYNVPTKINAKCNNDSDKHNCTREKDIEIRQDNYVKFVEIPDYKRYKTLEDFAQSAFTSDCNLSINEIETTTIRRLRIRPIVSSLYKQASTFLDDSGNEWSAYDVYVLQDEIQNLEAGKEIQVIGQVIADPKTGKITMLVSEIKYLDENKYDIEKIKKLRDFCSSKTPKEIMDFLTIEFEKYSRIIKRRNVAEIGLLSFFSPLYIDFEAKKIASWIKSVIIGDSTTGKSESIRQMIILLKAGQIISGEMASVAGLAGASVQATGGNWFLDFGVLPMQDRKFLAIDGAHKLRKEELDRLAEAERNGKIEINKAAKGDAYARTRQIKIFNPVDEDGLTTIPMDSFLYPVQALKHTLQIQSIARIDLCCFVSDDIEVKERNIKTNEPYDEKLEYLSELVRLVWSNNYDVIFDGDSIQSILDQATILEKKFKFDEYPLITNDQKYKLAKLASSIACLTCSFNDDFTKIIVKKEHIEYLSNLIDREYSLAGLSDLSSQSKFNEIDLDYIYILTESIKNKINVETEQALEIIEWITKQQKINREDIIEEFTLTRDRQAQPLLTYLKNEKIIKMARNHYSIAKKGVSIARFIVNFSSPRACSSTEIDTPLNKKNNFGGVSLLVELDALHALKIKSYKCNDCNTKWEKTDKTLEDISKTHDKSHSILEAYHDQR